MSFHMYCPSRSTSGEPAISQASNNVAFNLSLGEAAMLFVLYEVMQLNLGIVSLASWQIRPPPE